MHVLEAAAGLRTDGAAVTIFSTGHAAISGISEPLPALGGEVAEMQFVRADGRPLARLDLTVMAAATGHRVAFPPSQAQGANQALEGAWVLTHALRGAGTPSECARRYERARLRRVRRVSKLAATEVANSPPNPLAAALTRHMPPQLAGRA